MLEQFEQSLEQLDEAGITSIEVLQSVFRLLGMTADSSISSIEESSACVCSGACFLGILGYSVKLLRYPDLRAKYFFFQV